MVLKRELEMDFESGKIKEEIKAGMDKTAIVQRLQEIYKRLQYIDADSAEARAASILAVSL